MVSFNDTPDWQGAAIAAPMSLSTTSGYALLAGASTTLIAAVAGKTILILGITWRHKDTSSAVIALEDTSSNILYEYLANQVGMFHENWYGYQLPTGRGLKVANVGGINMAANDLLTIWYQQQ